MFAISRISSVVGCTCFVNYFKTYLGERKESAFAGVVKFLIDRSSARCCVLEDNELTYKHNGATGNRAKVFPPEEVLALCPFRTRQVIVFSRGKRPNTVVASAKKNCG